MVTDPLSHSWTKGYDNLNRLASETDPLTNTFGYTFWKDGRPKDFTDARTIVTRSDVDFVNKKATTTEAFNLADARTWEETFNEVAVTTKSKDPELNATDFIYNSVDFLTKATDALNHSRHSPRTTTATRPSLPTP